MKAWRYCWGALWALPTEDRLPEQRKPPKEKPAAIVDGSGMVLLPGLINCHTHLAQTALRNFFDDLSPKDSLEALLRF